MAHIKWIKLATCMPDDEKMKLIDAMPDRDTIHYLWIRLLIQAAKTNADGEVFLSDGMSYTDKMLAVIFSRPLASIKLALRTLAHLGMIEINSDKIIRIVNWDKHQNIEGMERVREQNRKRAENHREKKKQEKKTGKNDAQENYEDEVLEENKIIEEKKNSEDHSDSKENRALSKNEVLKNLKAREEAFRNIIVCDETNSDTNEAIININEVISNRSVKNTNNNENISNSTIETADNNSTITKNTSNVTQNESNVTVTEQNKKEKKNKNKKEKKEIDKEKNTESKKTTCDSNNKSLACSVNNKNSVCDEEVSQSNVFEKKKNIKSESNQEDDINLKALELMQYHEKITGKVGGCEYVALRSAIDIHGEKRVKMAMDVGFEKNCPDIKYAIGVLKNWRRDGYPEDHMEVKNNGIRSIGKNNSKDKNEFAGFKPKEPRKLTEAERKRAEANLI